MIKAIQQFFSMFSALFSAGEHVANSLNKSAEYMEESVDGFLKEARIEREQRLEEIKANRKPKLVEAAQA